MDSSNPTTATVTEHRRYSERNAVRIKRIQQLKDYGLTLAEIRELFELAKNDRTGDSVRRAWPRNTARASRTRTDAGDALAMELKEKSIRVWAFGIVNMIHAYDPDRVIVSGGIIKHNENIIVQFQEIVSKHTWTPWGIVEVVKATWPEHNAILGCDYLLQHV